MSTDHRAVLIIAGGSGTRLWPMSRKSLPKQFQPLFGKETPFQLMVRLATQVVSIDHVYVMAIPDYRQVILEQFPHFRPENILYEPAQRDTGPAVALGILQIAQHDPQATVATMWSDHLVLDSEVFAQVLGAGFEAAEKHPDHLVNVGSRPTKPDPSLGYIHMDTKAGMYNGIHLYRVAEFIEKPELARAKQFVKSGKYLWNVGYNVMNAASFITKLKTLNPEQSTIIEELETNVQQKDDSTAAATYEKLPKISIDYLLIQKLHDILVIPADMGWSDIGTWTTLHEMMVAKTGNHLVTEGEVRSINTENSLVFAKDRPITLVGVRDLVVVDTGDTILIMGYEAPASDLKSLVQETLTETNPELL